LTLLLPYLLLVVLVSTILDTALVPYLGFAFFLIGYPRPQKQWQELHPVRASQNEPKSDGHIFMSMQPQLHHQLHKMIASDPFNFDTGSFYLLKNEKMIMLV